MAFQDAVTERDGLVVDDDRRAGRDPLGDDGDVVAGLRETSNIVQIKNVGHRTSFTRQQVRND